MLSGCRFCGIARCLVFDFGWVLSSGFDLLRLACLMIVCLIMDLVALRLVCD